MPIEKINPYELFTKMFSDEGYCSGAFCIKLQSLCSLKVLKVDNLFHIKFEDQKPEVIVGKMIPIKTTVPGIKLGVNGGTLELDNFPDIPFFYTWIMEDQIEPIQFDRKDLAELFTKAAAQKLVNSILDIVLDSIASENGPKNESRVI